MCQIHIMFLALGKPCAVLMDQGPLKSNYRHDSQSEKQVSKKPKTSQVRFDILTAARCCKQFETEKWF